MTNDLERGNCQDVTYFQVVERVASAKAVGERSELASRNLRLLEKVGQQEEQAQEGEKSWQEKPVKKDFFLKYFLSRCSKRLWGTMARSHSAASKVLCNLKM